MYNQKYHHFDFLYNHKYGFHINGPRQDAFDAALRMRPRIVKTLDFSVEAMKNIRREIPDVFLIGRLTVSPQDFGQMYNSHAPMSTRIKQARQKGKEMATRILRQEANKDIHHVNGRRIFSAWESLNEIFPESVSVDEQKLFDEYQLVFGQIMRSSGFEAIGMNFATGNFRGKQVVDNFPRTLETYKYLGFHEYDWPTMDRLHKIGLNEAPAPKNIKDRVPLAGEGRGNDGMWLTLRYRRIFFEGVRQKYGDKHTAIITECGMTQGAQGGPDLGPWDPNHPIPIDSYWQSLMWYNSELMKDDYVMGACLFVTGAAGNPDWETFEHLGPIMDRLAAFQKKIPLSQTDNQAQPSNSSPDSPDISVALHPTQPATTQPTAPLPETASAADPNTIAISFPKVVARYRSHYVLFPRGTEDWWYAAAKPYLRQFGPTRGENLRDALFLRGKLGHTITGINLSPRTIAQIKKYAPNAQLDIIRANSSADLAAELKKRIKRNKPY